MRNPNWRHEIMAILSRLWALHSELQFYQLIALVTGDDSLKMSDDEFYRELLRKYMDQEEKEDPMLSAIREIQRYEED